MYFIGSLGFKFSVFDKLLDVALANRHPRPFEGWKALHVPSSNSAVKLPHNVPPLTVDQGELCWSSWRDRKHQLQLDESFIAALFQHVLP